VNLMNTALTIKTVNLESKEKNHEEYGEDENH
jgi:hypothetical protein